MIRLSALHRAAVMASCVVVSSVIMTGCGGIAHQPPAPTITPLPSPTATPISVPDAGSPLLIYRGHGATAVTATWSPDGTRIASGGNDDTLQVWDAKTGNKLWGYTFPSDGSFNGVFASAWSPDGNLVAGGDFQGKVIVFDAKSGTPEMTLTNPGDDAVDGVAFSPDGKKLATGTDSNGVHVWDLASHSLLLTYKGHTGSVTRIAWSPAGTHIASASYDGTVQTWDATTGQLTVSYSDLHAPVWVVAWSPDGKRLVSGTGAAGKHGPNRSNNGVAVWDAATGKTLVRFTGHGARQVYAATWSPDGTKIVSGDEGGTAYVWESATGQPLLSYHAQQWIWSCDWSPKTGLVASPLASGEVQLWRPSAS